MCCSSDEIWKLSANPCLEKSKRPVSAVADNSEFRDIEYVEIYENKNIELKMLFDPKTNLEERIINEQFIY